MNTITVYNLGGLPTAGLDEFNELQEDFKIPDPEKNLKLQMLIITRGFKYAFKAWKATDGTLWIIDAHQRKKALAALRKRGFLIPPIPYEPIQALSKKEAVEEIAAYNSEFAKKNPDTHLFEKYDIGIDTLEQFSLSFGNETLDLASGEPTIVNERIETYEDEPPALREDRVYSRPGDLWLLGRHRLLCGDSTDSNAVRLLMNGKKADLVITDPPYNVNYTGKTKDALQIRNDNMDDNSFFRFLFAIYGNMSRAMKDGAAYYIFHADTEGHNFRKALIDSGLKLAQCLVWVKQTFILGRQDYHWRHEPVLYGWKDTSSHRWRGDRSQSTVIEFDRPIRNDIHPTMKPVGLIAYLMQNSSLKDNIVLDLFGGSGSTMMAAEQTGRVAYLMELDPVYVDAEIIRYYNFKHDENIRLVRSGKTFTWNDIKNELL